MRLRLRATLLSEEKKKRSRTVRPWDRRKFPRGRPVLRVVLAEMTWLSSPEELEDLGLRMVKAAREAARGVQS